MNALQMKPATYGAFLRGAFVVLVVLALALSGYIVLALFALSVALLVEAVIVASRFERGREGRTVWWMSPCVLAFALMGDGVRPRVSEVSVTYTSPASFDRLAALTEIVRWQ